MGPLERRVRAWLNPLSTGLTRRWHGLGVRRVPPPNGTSSTTSHRGISGGLGVASPGRWTVPPGVRPGWDWLPEHGAIANLRAMPRWARVWYRLPIVDRYAYEWMWWHGGWAVLEPGPDTPSADNAG